MSSLSRISVEDLPTKDFLITEDKKIIDAIKTLNKNKKIVYVVSKDDFKLCGSITDGDIRRSLLGGFDVKSSVCEAMQATPKFLNKVTSDKECIDYINKHQVSSLPILDKKGRIVELVFKINNFENKESIDNNIERSALIMAGGMGKRLMPLTKNCPKPMLLINNKPMLEIIINNLKKYGYNKIFISVNYLANHIKDYFKDGSILDVEITYVEENKPLGTAGCLYHLRNKVNGPLLVMNGDIITSVNFEGLISFHLKQRSDATMVVRPHEVQSDFGVVSTHDLDIIGFEEKPVYVSYINTGIYMLNPGIFNYLDGSRKDMPNLFLDMKKDRLRTIAYPMHEDWKDIGNKEEYNSIKDEKF
ncbi:MAG: nucleotidyltransferase family protein [Candidatus Marinimicrobia bacterium]|nr:nucleotidyltransferase family protein [Candidatus Neomarinimicrobiota bacterium]MDA1363875.1 nucleotidyltransferase family protein [Candidatus Neomarinimicrobiota bacterium]